MKDDEVLGSLMCPINEIISGLYLGNLVSGQKKEIIEENQIKFIIQACNERTHFEKHVKYLSLPELVDIDEFNIEVYFEKCIEFIFQNIKSGNVLVHCAAGASRSASIVIAYLMYINSLSFEECLKFVQKQRPCVLPNQGFQNQLKNFEKKLKLKD